MASRFSEYLDEGFTAHRASRNREAALLFARAKEVGRLSGERAEVFRAGYWETEAWLLAGEYRRAYALLFALLADAPEGAPVYERWLAEKTAYSLRRDLDRRTGTERMARLEAFAASHPQVPSGDLPEMWAELAEDTTDWTEALRRYEEAWTKYDGLGYLKSGKALGALRVLLRLDRDREGARWLELLGQTQQDRASGRLCFHKGLALLALFRGEDRAEWDAARRALEEDLAGTQTKANAGARHLLARLWLVLRPRDDPEDRFHPARNLLRQRPETGRHWERLLMLADFRLAAVRHAARAPACDDYYYRQPQALPAPVNPPDPQDFARRVQRARLALGHLRQEADDIDRRYECVWHGGEARAREARLEAIVRAATNCQCTEAANPTSATQP